MITILQSPGLYTPVYNSMRFVLSSTNTAQDNFKYVADVYVSGVSGRVFRGLYSADPVYGTCAADISRVVEAYISKDFDTTVFGFQQCTNSLKGYEVKFGEQYGPSSGIVTYPNITVTGLKYAWNGVFNTVFGNPAVFNYANYSLGLAGELLTSKPTQQYYNSTSDSDWLYFINDTSGTAYFADFNVFDINGNNLSHFKFQNAYQASSGISQKLLRVGVGHRDVQSTPAIILISGSGSLVSATGAAYYTVQLTDFFGVTTSSSYTYSIECTSRHGSAVRLMWLNRLGGYDCFNFQLYRSENSEISRDVFQKNLGDLSGTDWSYNNRDAGETVFNTEITDSFKACSDWINDEQAIWLQELFESPSVFVNTLGGVPVIVKQTRYDKKTIKNERLFNVEIEFKYANKRWTQRT